MAPKKVKTDCASAGRKLTRYSIEMKKVIIEEHEKGVRVSDLASQYGIAKSTICTFLKHKDRIKDADVAKGVFGKSNKRPKILEKVEQHLLSWINERQLQGNNVNESLICEKARHLHSDLATKMPSLSNDEPEEFKASRGWFENFRKRSGFQSPSIMLPENSSRHSHRAKRKLSRTTIEVKKEVIAKYENGMRVSDLAVLYGIPKSTISTFLKNKDVIKAADVAKGAKVISKQRPPILEEVEKLLLKFVNEELLNEDSLNEALICEKALQIYGDLVKKTPSTSAEFEFKASRGWCEKFKKRSKILSAVRQGEEGSSKKEAAGKFKVVLLPKDDGDLKSQGTVYIKSEVPDSELEFFSIKEEPTDLHQEPSENSLDAEVPSSPSFSPAALVPGVLPSAPASASPSAELLNSSRCSTATPDAASKPTSKTKELSVHDVIKMAVSQIASISAMESKEYSAFGEVVANELSKMEHIQQTIAKKLINDVIYMGVMGSLKPNMHVAE
ncbi:DNA binding HTH domain Psq-type [Trinorchestia longiramus]|nr:DNA binding HTH domain Psq-type [Trinorchestia longiramus]